MFFYELFPETEGDIFPTLPVDAADVALMGLGDTAPLSWESVCSIALNRGAFRTVSRRIPTENNTAAVKFAIHAVALANCASYRGILDAINAEYNPVENYDMTEDSTLTYNGGETTEHEQTTADTRTQTTGGATDTLTIGSNTVTQTAGDATDTVTIGQSTQTQTTAAASDSNVIGTSNITTVVDAVTDTTETTTNPATVTTENAHDVVGYDNVSGYNHESKDTQTVTNTEQKNTVGVDYGERNTVATDSGRTETHNIGARSGTNTDSGRTETTAHGGHTDTTNDSGRTETTAIGERTTTENYTAGDRTERRRYTERSDVNHLRRHGNIGVTTSQQLLESQIELTAKTNLASRIAQDILNQLCVANYWIFGGENCESI